MRNRKLQSELVTSNGSRSEETIYEWALPSREGNSSSSDEMIDTSDEHLNNELEGLKIIGYGMNDFSDERRESRTDDDRHWERDSERRPITPARPTTSRPLLPPRQLTPEEKAEGYLREVEASKARILPSTGKVILSDTHSVLTDENFLVVGSHVDQNMVEKIQKGEYVDFSKLLPRDRILVHEDQRLEMVIRDGQTFYVPVNEGVVINGFPKWEQAFRVFSNIYTKYNPSRSSELIEYNHIIHTIAMSYTWENVYLYDKDFRLHMSRNPRRSWSVILQQAWALRLKDRVNMGEKPGGNGGSHHHPGGGRDKFNEPCKRFNRGYCSFGPNCRYEHKCSYCLRFGHTILTCRKLAADKDRAAARNDKRRDSGRQHKEHCHGSHNQINNNLNNGNANANHH